MLNQINFPKVVTVLAIVFGVSLGLCGLTALASSRFQMGGALVGLGLLELAVMALSGVGLVVTVVAWVIASAVGGPSRGADPQKVFESKDDDQPNTQ